LTLQPLAIISFDRRKLHGDDEEQWLYDGVTVLQMLDECDLDIDSTVEECLEDNPLPDGINRFILYGRWVGTYDRWNGDYDAWLEDLSLVPRNTETVSP
jgi:hypothetical protein